MSGIRFAGVLWLILCVPVALWSQDTATYRISDPVEITDMAAEAFRTRSNETRFDRDSLGNYAAAGISADAVLKQAEGVYIRNYGGHGGIKTVSIRGFSSQQTTVSINGVPYRNPQSGIVNFASFYPEGYSAISLTRSVASPDLNPLGGNVDFRIRPQQRQIILNAGAGSFGESMAGISMDLKKERTGVRIGYHFLKAKDNFPFELNGEKGDRANAAFNTQQYQLFAERKLSKALHISLMATGHSNRQQIPGPVLTGNQGTAGDSLAEDDLFYYLRFRYAPLGKGSGKIPAVQTLLLSYHFQRLAYTTPSRTENYRYQDLLGQWKLQYLFGKQSLSASLQFAYTRLSGDNLAIDFSPVDEVDRKEANAGLTHRLKTKGLILETSFRANYLQAFGLLPNGGINLSWSPGKLPSRYETFLHLHYGHRIPAFNELYYFGYGNSDLSPEKVRALEYGALYRPVFGNLNLLCKATGFLNRTKDKIITIPVNPVRWSTLSIGKTGSSGLELSMEAEWRKRYRLFVNYTLQKAVDLSRVERPLLPYTPREVLNYGFGIRWKGFEADISGQYSGWRFALLQNDASSFLSEYHILDAAIAWSSALGKIRMRIGVEAENMLDARYEVIRSYPMPAASYRLRIQLIY